VKGAPEALSRSGITGTPEAALARATELAHQGCRVLALAEARSGQPPRFLGLVGLEDPPRDAARDTIERCRAAGIRVSLVTGDHVGTATAVARAVGLDGAGAVDLSELRGGLEDVIDQPVLARASPDQKLEAVRLWQQRGEVVAMTGDGVNDAPALRLADIGVAMGERGTDVARQAADLVLADDELGTVAAAVEEGRRVYANIRRFLLYGLASGASELLIMLTAAVAGWPLPLLPAQILWLNLLTHGLAGTALGAEPAETGLMTRPPRNPGQRVLGGGLGWRVLVLGAALAGVGLLAPALLGVDTAPVRHSVVLLVLGAGQLGVALGARARRPQRTAGTNRTLPVMVGVAALLLVAATVLPPLSQLLGTAAVPGPAWPLAVVTALGAWWGSRALNRP
ncbi:MAG: hypothetical protein JWP61_562, partial [Friedmanniella sp.]|nr:hypothetical protein [Friedmanniella sp.]